MSNEVGDLGNNTLVGIDGESNVLYGDTDWTLPPTITGGNDSLTGGANSSFNILLGDAEIMFSSSTGGNDILTGGANTTTYNSLVGDASEMNSSVGGNDVLTGGANAAANFLYGDGGDMYSSTGGNDILTGGAHAGLNHLVGDANAGQNGVVGGADRLVSGTSATDHMWGDFRLVFGAAAFGADTFVFGPDNGNDIIHDFHQGEDTIELHGFGRFLPACALDHLPDKVFFRLLEKFTGISIETVDANQDGSLDSIVHFDAGNSVTVLHVARLTASDFDFA